MLNAKYTGNPESRLGAADIPHSSQPLPFWGSISSGGKILTLRDGLESSSQPNTEGEPLWEEDEADGGLDASSSRTKQMGE